jgi:protein-L-isoaspartate(D-aspartate) O-methyltransferase
VHVGDGLDGWRTAEPYDVIVVTGSLPSRRQAIEQQLASDGRLFVVVGTAPVMEALLITRLSPDGWSSESLFETELTPLIGATPKPEFRF